MLTSPRSMSRQDAQGICLQFLATTFDRHFTADGLAGDYRERQGS
jgi:hypothetical protein